MSHNLKKINFSFNKFFNIKIVFSIIVLIISIFHVSLKENFHIDELFTYGLSNNQFQLIEDDYNIYTGEDVLINYTAVKENNRFNIKNVFFNQIMDTHPPFYYMIVNFISSINVNKFSKWYGLSINIFFSIFIFWQTYYILYEIIKNKKLCLFSIIISMFFYGFVNAIVFTRMYIMLQFFSLYFFITIYKLYKSENKNIDFKMLFKSFLIFYLAGLTQYHFYIFAILSLIIFSIYILFDKRIKLFIYLISGNIISFILSYLTFPAMIKHIFFSDSLHNISNIDFLDIFEKINSLFNTIIEAYFGNIIIFILFLLIFICFLYLIFIKNILDLDEKKLLFSIFFITVFYFFIICCTVKLSFTRYLFNLYPFVLIIIISALYKVVLNFNKNSKLLFFIFLLIFVLFSRTKKVSFLNVGDNNLYEYVKENKNILTILLYNSENYDKDAINSQLWKLPYPIYSLRACEKIVFVDTKNENWQENDIIKNNDNFFAYIYTVQDDEKINSLLQSVNNVKNVSMIYKTSYITGYRFY